MSDDLTCSGCGEYIGSHISDLLEAQAKEIERLRKALESVLAHRYGDWCDIARAALGERP